ncbi:hypothetical protein K502DRAFT_326126 [Neoconidiobolus thromboides FSU 785]|nr:hypothetical protein K502DRAFT_326126 [Neoconidiobolus thromboides FSU 785]
MERAVDGTGAELLRPLWGLDSEVILDELFEAKFQVYITCINKTKIKDGEKWIGKLLSYELLKESDSGLNLLGEFGEYHTMCVYSPLYTIDFRTLVKQNSKLNLPSNEYMLDKSIMISTNIKSSSCNNFYYWEF